MDLFPYSPDEIARLWAKVIKDEHWVFTGTPSMTYGHIKITRNNPRVRTMQAVHQMSYRLHYSPIPDGLFVCHHCDIPKCIKPTCLFLGTPQQNTLDALAKDRLVLTNCRAQAGTSNGMAELTEDDVRDIRILYADGFGSQQAIADEFGVSQVLVSKVVRRKLWAHVS